MSILTDFKSINNHIYDNKRFGHRNDNLPYIRAHYDQVTVTTPWAPCEPFEAFPMGEQTFDPLMLTIA